MRKRFLVMSSSRQELLFAYRWPIALVGSSLILGGAVLVLAQTAVRLLSQPIPIAIEGGLQVDKLVLPPTVNISSATPLPVVVNDPVSVANKHPLTIRGPLTVKALQGTVQVKGDVQAKAQVTSIETPVTVQGEVSVKDPLSIKGKVTVDGKVGAKVKPTLLPMPIK
jgi:hypothetical protein